ncbi:MAG: dicarboxylate/amino acid:cation symporter [Planctomycetota bacterium]|nr:MAG: dicarboxylate/amino acid:cation symporter [Planctomycetota bacterium]
MRRTNLLTALVVAALIVGALIGHAFLWDANATPEAQEQAVAGWREAGNLLFIRPLMLIVIPLIFTSVLTGIVSIGDPKRLGVVGGATLVFYVLTMVLAVAVGITLAATFEPGAGVSPDLVAQAAGGAAPVAPAAGETGLGAAWLAIARQLIPDNFLRAAVERQALSVISATILLGVGLIAIGERARPFTAAVEALHEALMRLVLWIIWLMPLGVLLLVAWGVGRFGLATLASSLGKFVLIVVIGLAIHMFITLPVVLRVFGGARPFRYMWGMRPALLMAFGTASSMATLPVTIEAAQEAGASKRAAGLVLPLGATVNMDGTALYQGIAVVFMFQAFGYDLTFAQYLVIVLTATLSAIGAAGVPGGSLATIIIIVTAVNTTLRGAGVDPLPLSAIGLILAVDRVLDMCRTTVNVWGDSVGARIMTRLAPDLEEERERAFA